MIMFSMGVARVEEDCHGAMVLCVPNLIAARDWGSELPADPPDLSRRDLSS